MKMNAIRRTGIAFILFVSLVLVGCSTPYSTVTLKPFSDTEAESKIIGPGYPDLQEALAIIDSVLTKNGYFTEAGWTTGYVTKAGWSSEVHTSKGWYIEKTYVLEKPSTFVMVCNEGDKQPSTELKAGKRSIQILVEFREGSRFFLKAHPDVIRVRDEIAGELIKRFGTEKVNTFTGRITAGELM